MSDTSQLGSAGIGIGTGIINNALSMGMNSSSMDEQANHAKDLSNFNREMAMQMWHDTNYSAQMKEMEKAGLSPGLIYPKGGGGGTTANVPTGSVSQPNMKSDAMAGMGMMLNNQMIESSIELNKANAEKARAEAGEAGARVPTYAKGMELTDSQIKEIATKMGVNEAEVKSKLQGIEESKSNVKANEQNVKVGESQVNKNQAETTKIQTLTPLEANNLEQELKSKVTINKYLDQRQRQELENMIVDNMTKINQLRINKNEVEIKAFAEEVKANYPSVWNVIGKGADTVTGGLENFINWLTGSKDYEAHRIEKSK